MNNLAYTSQDAATVGPKVEEKVREDLTAAAPIPYDVGGGDAGTMTAGSIAADLGKYLFGGSENSLFVLNFTIGEPRVFHLAANVTRYGRGSYVGLLVYTTTIAKTIAGDVLLEDPKMFGKAKFAGDAVASGKLNGNAALVKLAGDLARTEATAPSGTVKMKRRCQLSPVEGGTVLIVHTLPPNSSNSHR